MTKPKVLIVDDDVAITQQLFWTLCDEFEVMTANGLSSAIRRATIYEPDALVRCGEPLPDDAVRIVDPVVVVEVLSPSSRTRDTGWKLEDYFRLASVRHYLIVETGGRSVIHHRKDAAGRIETRILRGGALELDPPGLAVAVETFFA